MNYINEQHYWDVQDGVYGVLCDIDVKCTYCDAHHTIEDNTIHRDWQDADEIEKRYFEDIQENVCCSDCAEEIEKRGLNVPIVLFEELFAKELFNYEEEPDWDFIRKSEIERKMVEEHGND